MWFAEPHTHGSDTKGIRGAPFFLFSVYGLPIVEQDDWYEGYFIPKGTAVIANVWELNHDPEIFGSDAGDFNPARYLDEKSGDVLNPPNTREDGHFTFGAPLGMQIDLVANCP